MFSSGAYLGKVEIEKSAITLKYATVAERIYLYNWNIVACYVKQSI